LKKRAAVLKAISYADNVTLFHQSNFHKLNDKQEMHAINLGQPPFTSCLVHITPNRNWNIKIDTYEENKECTFSSCCNANETETRTLRIWTGEYYNLHTIRENILKENGNLDDYSIQINYNTCATTEITITFPSVYNIEVIDNIIPIQITRVDLKDTENEIFSKKSNAHTLVQTAQIQNQGHLGHWHYGSVTRISRQFSRSHHWIHTKLHLSNTFTF